MFLSGYYKRKFKSKSSPYNQSLKKRGNIGSILKYLEEKYHDVLRKSSPGPVQIEVRIVNSENPYFAGHFEGNVQANISLSEQSIENP